MCLVPLFGNSYWIYKRRVYSIHLQKPGMTTDGSKFRFITEYVHLFYYYIACITILFSQVVEFQ